MTIASSMSAKERKGHPVYSGVLRYFPDALLEVAELSRIGNDQHNPGQPLHWAKEKSQDEGDALIRHLLDVGTRDTDGVRHAAKVAWRALALLQREIDAEMAEDAKQRDQWMPDTRNDGMGALPTTVDVPTAWPVDPYAIAEQNAIPEGDYDPTQTGRYAV